MGDKLPAGERIGVGDGRIRPGEATIRIRSPLEQASRNLRVPLSQDLNEEISTLKECFGLTMTKEISYPKCFGDSQVTFEGEGLVAGLTRERGQLILEFFLAPNQWLSGIDLLSGAGIDHKDECGVLETIRLLERNRDAVSAAIAEGPDEMGSSGFLDS